MAKAKKKNTKKAAKKRAIKKEIANKKNAKKKKRPESIIKKTIKKTIKKPITKKSKRIKNLSKSTIENQIKKALPKQVSQPKEKRKVDLIKIDIMHEPSNKIVIFDTNFLLIPEEFKIDIFTQTKKLLNARKVDFMIFDKTIYELQKIAALNSKSGTSAKVALLLINKNKVNIITSNDDEYVDDMLINYENYLNDSKKNVIIGTQDKELKIRLKEKGIKTLIMANKSKLAIK